MLQYNFSSVKWGLLCTHFANFKTDWH